MNPNTNTMTFAYDYIMNNCDYHQPNIRYQDIGQPYLDYWNTLFPCRECQAQTMHRFAQRLKHKYPAPKNFTT